MKSNKELLDLEPEDLGKVLEEEAAKLDAAPKPEPEPEPVKEEAPPAVEEKEPVVEAVNPYDERFKELGLDKQYKSVDDMMARLPYYNKYTTQVAMENAELKRQREDYERRMRDLEARRPANGDGAEPEYDPEAFIQEPQKFLDQRYPTREELAVVQRQFQKTQEERLAERLERFAEKHPDIGQVEPFMVQLAQEDPGYLGLKDPLTALYEAGKRRLEAMMPQEKPKPTPVVRQSDKDKAQTAGTGAKPTATRGISPKDLASMSLEELEKYFGYAPE